MSFPHANVKSPTMSPSLGEFNEALLTDESAKVLELFAAVTVDANGHSNLGTAVILSGNTSQVTDRKQGALVQCPGGEKVRLLGLMSLDSVGNLIPFVAPSATSAASATTAASVSGKFQSTVQTGNGASQNIAHGLGVVPSLVLASIVDTNGVALPFSLVEGAHDSTNLKITVTTSVKYKIIAFA